MAAGNSYCLGIKSNDFFLKDNKKAFILWLNVPKVTAYNSKIFFANLRESSRKFRVSRKKALPLHRHSEGDASTRVARTELTNNLT